MYYGTYTCISDLIHVLQSIYWSYGSYTCITEHVLVLRILYGAYSGTKVPVGTTQIHFTKVPVGTTRFISLEEQIFVLISDSYTYTCTCPYHRHIFIKSLIGIIEFLCVRRYT